MVRVIMDENIKYPMYGKEYYKRPQYSADMIHQEAMKWLDKQDGKQPFFGIFTYTLPHAELVQPEDSILEGYQKSSSMTRHGEVRKVLATMLLFIHMRSLPV